MYIYSSAQGLNNIDDENGFLFGDYRYDNTKSPSQYFPVQVTNEFFFPLPSTAKNKKIIPNDFVERK